MKASRYIVIVALLLFLALIAKILVNEYEISGYKSQIEDLRQIISYSEVADSVLGIQSDSIGRHFYIVHRDEDGEILTYQDLMETIEKQEHIITIQDIVIRNAKQIYKFNYAVKDSCGIIHTRFWNKPENE